MSRKASLLATMVSASLLTGCGTDAQLKVRAVGAEAVMPVGDLVAEGRTNFALNNVALALERFRRAIRLQPDNVDALNGMAACYDRMGRFDLSRSYYEKALAVAPNNPKTLHNFRLSLTLQGRHGEALALAREAAQPQAQAAAAVTTEGFVSASGPEGVTVPLPPLPAPQTQPSGFQARAAEPAPAEAAPAGPRLERVSLAEVQLVTAPTVKPQSVMAKRRQADRVVQVTRAERAKQTRTSSEWVFPEAPVMAAPPAPAPEPRPVVRTAAAEVAAVAPPAPRPIAEAVAAPTPTPSPMARRAPEPRAPFASAAVRASALTPAVAPAATTAPPALPPRPAKPAVAPAPTQVRRATAAPAPRVQVLNAVGRKGLAGRYSRYLQARGWAGPRAADARRPRNATLILYPAGSRAQAAALARRLPFRTTLAPSKRHGSGLLLVLGNDALAFDNRLRLRAGRA